jgi:ribonuclease J
LKNSLFSITPIGGVSEIGSNFTLIEHQNQQIVIDYGILFPYEDFFDINYLIANTDLIKKDLPVSLFVTHGHEDHIGAIPHLVKEFPNIKIYASKFTDYLIRKKCGEHNLKLNIEIYTEADIIKFGDIEIHPVHVNHSIPETFGFILKDKNNVHSVLFISDFKVDLNSKHEKAINIEKINSVMKSSAVKSCFLDSTNVLLPKKTVSENELELDLDHIISSQDKRIFITLFASNVHRMDLILKLAKKYKRRISMLGRSIRNYAEAGIATNHLDFNLDEILEPENAKNFEDRVLVLVSGCQGDYKSALRRLASNEDSSFKLNEGDTFVFSSKVIPGNEKKISRIYNDITKLGAKIITDRDLLIHASGHPGQEDLKILLNSIECDQYFPIHGESFFLKRHNDFVNKFYPKIQTNLIHNYTRVSFHNNNLIKMEKLDVKEPILIHGNMLPIEKPKISERRKMACQGAVFVSFKVSKNELQITTQGIPDQFSSDTSKIKSIILNKYQDDLHHRNQEYKIDQLKILIRQYFNNLIGYKPVTVVHLVD